MSSQITATLFSRRDARKALALAGLAPFAVAAALVWPGVVRADTQSIDVVDVRTERLYVNSNGSSYSHVLYGPIVVDLHIQADAEVSGYIQGWTASIDIVNEDDVIIDLSEAAISKTYSWSEHIKEVDRIEMFVASDSLWKHQVKAMCNELADELRAEGLDNAEIFAEDRKFNFSVLPRLNVSASGATGLQQADAPPHYSPNDPQIEVVCKKWGGAQVPVAGKDLTTAPAKVIASGLSIIEQDRPSGVCKIRLDGWFTTDHKGATVSYRFETYNGEVSNVESANSGDSKTATFSRWEDIANEPSGNETGKVRVVGVSHDFQTDWVDYHLECTEGGPGTIVANNPPKLAMSVVPHGAVMVQGRICPQSVKLVGVLFGHGSFSGQAVFFGPGYISPLRDYTIAHGEKVLVGAEAELHWRDVTAASPVAPLSQMREFGFNVTNENGSVIASIPQTAHFIECKTPKLTPGIVSSPAGGAITYGTPGAAPQSAPATGAQLQRGVPGAAVIQRAAPEPPAPRRLLRQRRLGN